MTLLRELHQRSLPCDLSQVVKSPRTSDRGASLASMWLKQLRCDGIGLRAGGADCRTATETNRPEIWRSGLDDSTSSIFKFRRHPLTSDLIAMLLRSHLPKNKQIIALQVHSSVNGDSNAYALILLAHAIRGDCTKNWPPLIDLHWLTFIDWPRVTVTSSFRHRPQDDKIQKWRWK